MATSSLVQFTEDGFGRVGVSETFIASEAIAAGDWVMFDNSKSDSDCVLYVAKATVAGVALVCGVAEHAAAAAGDKVRVAVSGYVAVANVADAATAGDPLTISSTDGRAEAADATDVVICGAAISDGDASNNARVIVARRF